MMGRHHPTIPLAQGAVAPRHIASRNDPELECASHLCIEWRLIRVVFRKPLASFALGAVPNLRVFRPNCSFEDWSR